MHIVQELPHLKASPGVPLDDLYKLVSPYLSWELMATSRTSTQLLIGEPISAGDVGARQLLVLDGPVANFWLRHHSPRQAHS